MLGIFRNPAFLTATLGLAMLTFAMGGISWWMPEFLRRFAGMSMGTATSHRQDPEDAERVHITRTLRETNWTIGGPRGAAAQLGLPRTTLIARMQRRESRARRCAPYSPRWVPLRAMEAAGYRRAT